MDRTIHFRNASNAVWYETTMFFESLARCRKRAPDGWHENVTIEAVAMHARNLIEFYLHKSKKNLRADDWFDNNDWQTLRGTAPKALNDAHKKACVLVGHLTKQRAELTPELKDWAPLLPGMFDELRRLTLLFIEHAPDERLSSKLKAFAV